MHIRSPLQESEFVGYGPVGSKKQDKRQGEIYDYGRQGEREIDKGVLPFFVLEPKQRHGAFQHPEKGDSTDQNSTTVGSWNVGEVIYDFLHG